MARNRTPSQRYVALALLGRFGPSTVAELWPDADATERHRRSIIFCNARHHGYATRADGGGTSPHGAVWALTTAGVTYLAQTEKELGITPELDLPDDMATPAAAE